MSMRINCIVISIISLFLAGCVSVAPHGLADSELQAYRVVEVSVEGAEVISSWPAEEEKFLSTNTVDAETANRIRSEPAFQFPQLRQHFQQALQAQFRNELTYLTAPIFSGNRPARIVVRLRTFDIPSTARRVFVDSAAKLRADIDLVDKTTGRLVARYNGGLEYRKMIGGLATGIALAFERSDKGAEMITDYLSAYRNWLLRK
jgi:hypothetical protein